MGRHEPAAVLQFPPPWAESWGDDAFGLWAELSVGAVAQRLRWLAPGSFMMGSPEDEPERFSDEGAQHAVRISQGLWLADTACTQALWLAVLGGENPARFAQDVLCPVEQVSFDDVQGFLAALAKALPKGSEALLPTEAQWEYACRAGTGTPFSLGPNIRPEQVNYDGNHPYARGNKGLYRERTVPVKTLSPNAWGLYEMHGNVWEWCADAMRDFEAVPHGQALVDPLGPVDEGPAAHSAVRGGSWVSSAKNCRSACRFPSQRGVRDVNLGFRFALRSQAKPSHAAEPGQ